MAPPIIAGTIFVINSDTNTNGENVKNKRTFAYKSWMKLSIKSFNVKPSKPAINPKISVDMLVMIVNIIIHTRSIRYFEVRNFFLDMGMVRMFFNVCSLYSLPKR